MAEGRILRQLAWREIYARRKVFTVTTVVLAVLVGAAMIFGLGRTKEPDQFTIVHSIDLPQGFPEALGAMVEEGTRIEYERLPNDDLVRQSLEDGEGAVGIIGPLEALWGPKATFAIETPVLRALTASNLQRTADDLGLSPSQLGGLMASAHGEAVEGEDSTQAQALAFIAVILSFMAIITYGQWVAYGVVEEKSNRIIEIILGATSPRQILWAKILSIGSLGLGQFLVLIGISLGLGLAMDEIPVPDVAASTGAWLILWFVLGYGFYAALFAAAGSLASSSQEASASVGPMAIVPGIGYMTAFPLLSQATPTLLLKVMAFMPFWSPLLVPAMLAKGWLSPLMAGVAAALVAASVWVVVQLAARIYAGGVSQSTRTLGWREAFRAGSDLIG